MAEKRALSRHQFAESGFDTSGYAFNEIPGLHTAIIDSKRWGKHKLVTYFTFDVTIQSWVLVRTNIPNNLGSFPGFEQT